MFTLVGQERRVLDIGELLTLQELLEKAGRPLARPLVASPLIPAGPPPPMPAVAAPPPPPPGPTKLGGQVGARLDVAGAAKMLRTDLASTFPSAKFCVSIERYSGGESIRVSWIDGPSSQAVDKLLNKYEDIDYDPYSGEILSGGNRYVSGARKYSASIRESVKQRVAEMYATPQPDYILQDNMFKILQATDYFPQPAFKCERGIATPLGAVEVF